MSDEQKDGAVKAHRTLIVEVRVYEQLQTGDKYGNQTLVEPLNVSIDGGAAYFQIATAELHSLRDHKHAINDRVHDTIRHAANKMANGIADRVGKWLIDTTV